MSELDTKLNKLGVDRIAISPYKQWSRGYMEPGNLGNGYVTGLKVDAGVRDKTDDDVLDGIVSYIAVELSNPQAASDFVDKLGKVIDEIRSFPESGSYVNNEFLSDTEIRKKLIGSYIMYYLPVKEEKMIYVVRIVYGKRNMEEILRELDL